MTIGPFFLMFINRNDQEYGPVHNLRHYSTGNPFFAMTCANPGERFSVRFRD